MLHRYRWFLVGFCFVALCGGRWLQVELRESETPNLASEESENREVGPVVVQPKQIPHAVAFEEPSWAFEPGPETFDPSTVFSLRQLNETVAGESGFVRRNAQGDGFVLGNGEPVRFWAASTIAYRENNPDEALANQAQFLAKHGVNMVRYHSNIFPDRRSKDNPDLDEPNMARIDEIWRLVAAMKKEGIYTTMSPYWALGFRPPQRWGIEGWKPGMSGHGLLFFNKKLQEAYKTWLRVLLTEPNPYTGIPLADDPALAIIQIQNEDSMLFFTINQLYGTQLEILRRLFGEWLAERYGSVDAARKHWGNTKVNGDAFERGLVGIANVWEWKQPRKGAFKRRLDDQLQFFAETMYRFNAEIANYLREELGCKQLINAGNWRTADPILLNDVEHWTYTPTDIIAVNRYYNSIHLGKDRNRLVRAGHFFNNTSVLLEPRQLPTNIKQVAGHPTILSETLWAPPTGYQSESPFLLSTYGSLCGIDGIYWFRFERREWSISENPNVGAAAKKFEAGTPMVLGQFPAAAIAFRRSYVDEAEPVVIEHRTLQELWEREPPIIAEDASYDPLRDLGDRAEQSSLERGLDPRAFLAGPVTVKFDTQKTANQVGPLDSLISGNRIQSLHGQVVLESDSGRCLVDAPKAQGATGFLGKHGPIQLSDVKIETTNTYATVLVVSVDNKPIAESNAVLLQIGTTARPTGWEVREKTFPIKSGKNEEFIEGLEIVNAGEMPWRITEFNGTIEINNSELRRAFALDENLAPSPGRIELNSTETGIRLKVPSNTLHVLLRTPNDP